MGPSGECFADAVADRDGVSAFGDDAGEARDDEELECMAHLLNVSADDAGNAADTVGDCEFGSCVRAVVDWRMVLWFHPGGVFGLPFYFLRAEGPFEEREPAGVVGEPGIELFVQQYDSADGLLYGALGNALPCPERVCAGLKGDGWGSVL